MSLKYSMFLVLCMIITYDTSYSMYLDITPILINNLYLISNDKAYVDIFLHKQADALERYDFYYGQGGTPLHYAADRNHTKVIKYLIDNSVDVNAQTEAGDTPLLLAVKTSSIAAIKLLLQQANTDIDAQDEEGYTALHLAVHQHNHLIIKYLLCYGANVASKNIYHETPADIDYLKEREMKNILDAYSTLDQQINNSPTVDLLKKSIEQNFMCLVKKLLLSGIVPKLEHLTAARDFKSAEVGALLASYLGIVYEHSRISKTGIRSTTVILPQEIAERIACYTL
jgi:Ankyrin repeats (many copies)/Ankyrin repeat